MAAYLLRMYPGLPEPTSQMPLQVGTSFWYFMALRHLSLNIIHTKHQSDNEIQRGSMPLFYKKKIELNTLRFDQDMRLLILKKTIV